MSNDLSDAKKRLRRYLNPSISGPNTDAILESLAHGPSHLIHNVEAVYDQLYILSASEQYLDRLMADRGITRPDNVGLSDDIFREIGIEITTRKQIRDLLNNILRIMYGAEFTRATLSSGNLEPYNLSDGDILIVSYDDFDPIEIVFKESQFSNINFATAQEVADAITREIRRLGKSGVAIAQDDGLGGYVQLISETDGASSSVRVLGGQAQDELRFEQIRPTTADGTTQWTLSVQDGGTVRATWTGGSDPSIGKIHIGDYVNIYGSSFDEANQGTYNITNVVGGLINESYVEFDNPAGIDEVVVQGVSDAILFYNPVRSTLLKKSNYAALFQVEPQLLEIFIPATTRVVRRIREGSAHIHESGPSGEGNEGPYIYDREKPYLIGGESTTTTQVVDFSTNRVIEVDNSLEMPDQEGFLVFGFGTNKEEGPVPYIARPSSNTILLDPSYKFKNYHEVGTDISLISLNSVYDVDSDGTDYPFYITDTVSGRLYTEELIDLVVATGINVIITILYPNDIGLGKEGDVINSEKYYIWGSDPE